MAMWERTYIQTRQETATVSTFATKVYGWMAIGLLVTACVAFGVIRTGLFMKLLPFWWVPTLGTFALALGLSRAANRLSYKTMVGMFISYATLQGVFFGTVLPLYALAAGGQVVWAAFLTAGLIFGGGVLYGILTKGDLTRFSRILQLGLMGLVGVTVVYAILSIFMPLPGMLLLISYVGLVLFVGLTAFEAQAIRRMSTQLDGSSLVASRLSLLMALNMYMNVIMIFWYLLQIFSASSRR